MSNWSHLTENLVKTLKKLPIVSLTANKNEISVRCPFCGDSTKNRFHSHLYIKLNVVENEPYTYYCQRCQASGYVDRKLINLLFTNISDNFDLLVNLGNYNKKAKRVSKAVTREVANIKVPLPEDNKLNRYKLNYINKRLNTQLTLEDLPKYKINLNLYDLLDENHITKLSKGIRHESFADTLDKNFIGFVSNDNNFITMRNLSKTMMPNMRYHIYNIFDKVENARRFYSIPTKLDLMQETIDVTIAEGAFDLLSVYFNIENQDPNRLYIAVSGVGYNNVILFLAKLGFIDINLRIYSDADQHVNMFKKLKKDYGHIINGNIELIYPRGHKDFGEWKGQEMKKSFI